MKNNLFILLCAVFAVIGAYLTVFGGRMLYTGREYGIALLALAVIGYCGVQHDP